jgi:hypothetical protein
LHQPFTIAILALAVTIVIAVGSFLAIDNRQSMRAPLFEAVVGIMTVTSDGNRVGFVGKGIGLRR